MYNTYNIYTPRHTFISWNPVQQEKGEEPQTTTNILHSVSLPSYSVVFRVLTDFIYIYHLMMHGYIQSQAQVLQSK